MDRRGDKSGQWALTPSIRALTCQSAGLAEYSMDYKDFCLTCLVTLAAINTVINLRSQRRR